MNEKSLMNFFTFFILLFSIILYTGVYSFSTAELEQSVNLIESLSKIDQVKRIEKVIRMKTEMTRLEGKAGICDAQAPLTNDMKIGSDMLIKGSITTRNIHCVEAHASGLTEIKHKMTSAKLRVDKINSQSTIVQDISSPNGILMIVGNIVINNDAIADNVQVKGSSFSVEGVKQWGVSVHDDFDEKSSLDGWSDPKTSACVEGGNSFLGGHCIFSFHEVSKVYKLPKHTHLRITGSVHMFDNWDGESVYMKLNDTIVWSRIGHSLNEGGMDVCGGLGNDPAFNIKLEHITQHSDNEVKVTFGSTLNTDPCEASWAIDDLFIYTK